MTFQHATQPQELALPSSFNGGQREQRFTQAKGQAGPTLNCKVIVNQLAQRLRRLVSQWNALQNTSVS